MTIGTWFAVFARVCDSVVVAVPDHGAIGKEFVCAFSFSLLCS